MTGTPLRSACLRILYLLLTAVFVPSSGAAEPPQEGAFIQIVHPRENARLPYLSSTFVLGSVPPEGKLTINGRDVSVHAGGGFLSMVDLSTGTFLIRAVLEYNSTTTAMTRKIFVEGPVLPTPVSPLAIEYVKPDVDLEVIPGDELTVSCKGSPGMKAYFTVGDGSKKYPMIEADAYPGGIYRGVYVVGQNAKLKKTHVRVTLSGTKKSVRKSVSSSGSLTLLSEDAPFMVAVSTPVALLRSGPALSPDDKQSYTLALPQGTVLRITGSRGDELRARLTRARDAWISRQDVKRLPEGTLPVRAVSERIAISVKGRSTELRIPVSRKVPFDVIAGDTGDSLDVVLFGATSNTDWMTYGSTVGAVEQVRWFQEDSETLRVHAVTERGSWWGYDARYEGNALVVELRSPPPAPPARVARKTPLSGLTVAVDAGHSPETGAVGPTGFLEKDANLLLALTLKEKLESLGARVVMTRVGNESVALYERPRIAWRAGADILISVHNNALPDGENPFRKNGYGVYYYHPLSLPLARQIHRAYGETVGAGAAEGTSLRDDGLYYASFVLARTTQMPSVLTESAYLIVPQEEAALRTESFRSRCADAIVRGIRRYLSSFQPH